MLEILQKVLANYEACLEAVNATKFNAYNICKAYNCHYGICHCGQIISNSTLVYWDLGRMFKSNNPLQPYITATPKEFDKNRDEIIESLEFRINAIKEAIVHKLYQIN